LPKSEPRRTRQIEQLRKQYQDDVEVLDSKAHLTSMMNPRRKYLRRLSYNLSNADGAAVEATAASMVDPSVWHPAHGEKSTRRKHPDVKDVTSFTW
jgi:hypothetical protein